MTAATMTLTTLKDNNEDNDGGSHRTEKAVQHWSGYSEKKKEPLGRGLVTVGSGSSVLAHVPPRVSWQ